MLLGLYQTEHDNVIYKTAKDSSLHLVCFTDGSATV